MMRRASILWVLASALFVLPACGMIKTLREGGAPSVRDLEGQGPRDRELGAQIAALEEDITRTLGEIERLLEEGRFRSAEYREDSLNERLAELAELSPKHPLLTSAPAKLESIRTAHTERAWIEGVLLAECERHVADASSAVEQEVWRDVESRVDDYVACRERAVDADMGVDMASLDARAVSALDAHMTHLLLQAQRYRREGNYRFAVGFEATPEDRAEVFVAIAPSSTKPATFLKSMNETREHFQDPREAEIARAKSEYDAWRAEVSASFRSRLGALKRAESSARPAYDRATQLLEDRRVLAATEQLLEARRALYGAAYPTAKELEDARLSGELSMGMSFEIALALARIHLGNRDDAALNPELRLIERGRPWMTDDEELDAHLFDVLASSAEGQPPSAAVRAYAGHFSTAGRALEAAKQRDLAMRGEAFELMGVELDPLGHRQASSNTAQKSGRLVWISERVTSVADGKLRFDFLRDYQVPVKCWTTKTISNVNDFTGRVYYEQKCTYKTQTGGYSLVVPAPANIDVQPGDEVAFFATVSRRVGAHDLLLFEPSYVRVSRGDGAIWFMGQAR